MSRKDHFHEAVKHALEKDGWLITHDPFTIQISAAVKLKIDLGAESTIAAQRLKKKNLIALYISQFPSKPMLISFKFLLSKHPSNVMASM
jgi:XisH protein